MAISSVSQSAVLTSSFGKASGSRDNALVDIFNTLTDESGRVSDEEKMAAYRRLGELGQATDSKNPYGYAGYSAEDIKLLNRLNESTFLRKLSDFAEKYSRFADEMVRAGKSASGTTQMQIDYFDSMSPLEQSQYDSDYRETLVAIKKIFLKLEEREAAGAYKSGTPIDQVTDPEARTALLLLEAVQSQDRSARARAREQVNELKIGGFGIVEDKVDLSGAAKAYLGHR